MKASDLSSILIKITSPEEVLEWSHGEVKKPETINYRTQRAEKDGLFCEKIFGPEKDFECYCGKYKGIRFKGTICDRCGVEITRSQVRRERMGHVKLAAPVSHIWFLKGMPSRIGMVLNIQEQHLERVIYFVSYIIEEVDEEMKKSVLEEVESDYKKKKSAIAKSGKGEKEKNKEKEELKKKFNQTKEEINQIEPLKVLSEIEYQDLAMKYGEIFEVGTGAEALVNIFKKIDLKKEIEKVEKEAETASASEKKKVLRRLKFLQGIEKADIRPEWMFLENLPVLPPELRPMVQLEGGRFASSDLNDLYRRVINRNNRLKYLQEISAPDAIVRNEKRMLQEAVDSLMDNSMRKSQLTTASTGGRRTLKSLADILSGKQGRFRKNLLGKRVDYSGRSVIAAGPEFSLNQCGLPKIMAIELFRPFIIQKLLENEAAYNIKGASHLIDEKASEVFDVLEEVVKGKCVLLNRAPTLHRLGIQAFEPVLIEGEAIKIHPLVCKAYNADFDGDQMGVYVPLSEEAQEEARSFMLSTENLLKPATGLPIATPTLDLVLGAYWITGIDEKSRVAGKIFSNFEEAIMSYELKKTDIRAPIKTLDKKENLIETTCGRIIFNRALPESFDFVNYQVGSKSLSQIISDIILNYPKEEVIIALDKVKDLGFEAATMSGITLGMDDFVVPDIKFKILKEKQAQAEEIKSQYSKGFLSREEKSAKVIEIWHTAKEEIEKYVSSVLPKNSPVISIVDSGARGSWAQPVQIAGMKGLVTSPSGKIIEMPIKHSFKEGFDVLEYFISTHGARKGIVDTALKTSASGYLTRRLADVAHEVIVTEDDCGDTEGRYILKEDSEEIGQDYSFKIVGRVSSEDIKLEGKTLVKKGEIIDWKAARAISSAEKIRRIRTRSPLNCKTLRGVCRKCYGWEMGRNCLSKLGDAVGVIASQSIGEPGTQLTMRTFHLGGVASGGDITRGLPRVEEIFELRGLKQEGVVALSDGVVKAVDLEKGFITVIPSKKSEKKEGKNKDKKAKKNEEMRYDIPGKSEIYVKKEDKVEAGQALTAGPLDLRKLYKSGGMSLTQRYIIKETQRIYVGEGINVHDKHIEVIARQMFSRLQIVEPGESPWVPGEVVSVAEFEEKQKGLKKEKRAKAQSILLGISRVALTSDSFLSAASFQETSRILIKAALEGAEDKLRGLKENVIIGRMIPAGTGFRK